MDQTNNKRSDILNKIITVSIFVLLGILALAYCGYQQVFTVKQIIVYGQHELTEKQVIQASGIKRGKKMSDLDLGTAIDNLIAEPYIFNAYVSRSYPDVINIYVLERQPVAMINLKEQLALDAFATVLPRPVHYQTDRLPVINGIDPALPYELGKMTFHPDVRHAINFVNYVQRFSDEIITYCSDITWSADKGWIIRKDKDHPSIYLGSEDLEKRFDILDAFISKMHQDAFDMRDYKYISLRFNGQVIVRD